MDYLDEHWGLPDPDLCESWEAAISGIKFLELEDFPGKDATQGQQGMIFELSSDSSISTASTVDSSRGSPGSTSGDSDKRVDEETTNTTLMIRNIPRKYTQRQLLVDLNDAHAILGKVDFFYLPADLGTGRNLGYCFVNFVQPQDAVEVKQKLHKLRLFSGAKSGLSIGFADVQGLESNLRNVRRPLMHRIKNREYRPLVLNAAGELIPVSN
jgi:RNA recognition motif-containing protein